MTALPLFATGACRLRLDEAWMAYSLYPFDEADDQEQTTATALFASIDVLKLDCAQYLITDRSALGISETRLYKRTCSIS